MARKGKAVVFRELNKPVGVEEITFDAPKRGEVVVKMAACGVCHSDLSAVNGTIPLPPPLVLGHEAAGVCDQLSKAARAASTAAFMSFSSPAGTVPITAPVPALWTSMIPLVEGVAHWPLM